MERIRTFLALTGCTALWLTAPAATAQPAPEPEPGGPRAAGLRTLVEAALGLRSCTLIDLNVQAQPGEALLAIVPIDGVPVVLDLQPHSVRANDYQVLAQDAEGSLVGVDPGPVRTLRGSVVGAEGAVVAGSLLDDGLYARIALADGADYWLEPIGARVAGAAADLYVLYRSDDVIAGDGVCAADDAPQVGLDAVGSGASETLQAVGGGVNVSVAQLAIDADFEYFQMYGSVARVEERINLVVAQVVTQYSEQVGIIHKLTRIIVRTAEPDPYSTSNPAGLLLQFQAHWEANHADVPRDLAQLFTGRVLSGPVIGIAFTGTVCSDEAYSLVRSSFNGPTTLLSCSADLSAHEMAHNWNANHCFCLGYTMHISLTCAQQFHPALSIPEIMEFRDSLTCLDEHGADTGSKAPGAFFPQ